MIPVGYAPQQQQPAKMAATGVRGGPPKDESQLKGKNVHKRAPLKVKTIGSYSKFSAPGLPNQTFSTKKRHPFIWPCDTCLHRGFTRTYVAKINWLKQIIMNTLAMVILFSWAAFGGVTMYISIVAGVLCSIAWMGFIFK